MNRNFIALIGPSGCGKSSLAPVLARKLAWYAIDSDSEIEKRLGMSIRDFFELKGEKEFRFQESLFLSEFCQGRRHKTILATGGGLPLAPQNWEILAGKATLVYLYAPLEVLVTRLQNNRERPLLAGKGAENPEGELAELKDRLGKLIAEREQIYERARYKIDTSEALPEELADDIIKMTGAVLSPGS